MHALHALLLAASAALLLHLPAGTATSWLLGPCYCSARGLVGNTLGCDSGQWERTDAGVGAGVDSFYEYLLKASSCCRPCCSCLLA